MGRRDDGERSSREHVETVLGDVSRPAGEATTAQVAENLPSELFYVTNDARLANPLSILGTALYEIEGAERPRTFVHRLDVDPNEEDTLKSPTTRAEVLLTKKAAANLDVLSMLTAEGEAEDVFEFRVIDNAQGRIDTGTSEFRDALAQWRTLPETLDLLADPRVGRISFVAGVVQKYISKKKFTRYSGKAEGNGWGVNLGGELYLSSSNYSLDIVYGLDLVVFRDDPNPEASPPIESIAPADNAPLASGLRDLAGDRNVFLKMFPQ